MADADSVRFFIAARLGVSAEELSDDVGVGGLPEWDSLGQLMLIMAIEERYSTAIDSDVAFELETVGDFIELLTKIG